MSFPTADLPHYLGFSQSIPLSAGDAEPHSNARESF